MEYAYFLEFCGVNCQARLRLSVIEGVKQGVMRARVRYTFMRLQTTVYASLLRENRSIHARCVLISHAGESILSRK